jgi:hypothetical protein
MNREELDEWADLHGENYPVYTQEEVDEIYGYVRDDEEEQAERQAEMDEAMLWNL